MSPTSSNGRSEGKEEFYEGLLQTRLKVLRETTEHPIRPFLELLVAMCGTLRHEDLARIGPFVWNECLELNDEKTVIHVSITFALIKFKC